MMQARFDRLDSAALRFDLHYYHNFSSIWNLLSHRQHVDVVACHALELKCLPHAMVGEWSTSRHGEWSICRRAGWIEMTPWARDGTWEKYIKILFNIYYIYIYTSILQQVSFRGFLGPTRSQLVTCWRMLVYIYIHTRVQRRFSDHRFGR